MSFLQIIIEYMDSDSSYFDDFRILDIFSVQ